MAIPSISRLPAAAVGAGARAAIAAAQRAVPQVVRDVQRLLEIPSPAPQAAGQTQGGAAVSIQNVPLALLGGLTLERARQMHEALRDARVARKNIWYIRVTDPNPPTSGHVGPGMSVGGVIDLLAQDVSYSPFTMASEKVNVGAAVLDKLSGTEAVELSLTTFDDEAGTIKRWFEGKCLQAASPDGTFGLPWEYCVNIEVVHAVSASDVPTRSEPYKSFMTMRPQAIQFDMSRRESAHQELGLSFSEFDTFLSAAGGIL